MTSWQVQLTYDGDPVDVDTVIAIGNDLDDDTGVGNNGGALSAVMTIDRAGTPVRAISAADTLIRGAARRHGLTLDELGDARAVTWDRAEAELDEPNYPDIVSAVEAADILGVSRQRVHQLRTTHDDFPEPLYELRTGPLWVRAGIEGFNDRWERRSGRPPLRAVG